MEHIRKGGFHVVAGRGEYCRGQHAGALGFGYHGRAHRFYRSGAGGCRQRFFADAHPQGRPHRRRLQSRFPFQRNHIDSALRAVDGLVARRGALLRMARIGSGSSRTVPAAARKRTVCHTEHHHGARIPFRAALGHNLCGIARERHRRSGHGGKRLRRMESRRTAGEHDGRKGRVAVDSQSVAAARGMQGLLTR